MKHRLTKHIVASLSVGLLSIISANAIIEQTDLHQAANVTGASCNDASDCAYGYYCSIEADEASGTCTIASRRLSNVLRTASGTVRETKTWEENAPEETNAISRRRLRRINALGVSTYTGSGAKTASGSVRETVRRSERTIERSAWQKRLDRRIRDRVGSGTTYDTRKTQRIQNRDIARENWERRQSLRYQRIINAGSGSTLGKRETVRRAERTIERDNWTKRLSLRYQRLIGTGSTTREQRLSDRIAERDIEREAYERRVRLRIQRILEQRSDSGSTTIQSQTK